jgi:hypothetical protein
MTHEEKVELLIRVDERTARLEVWTVNHMEHHKKLLCTLLAAGISVITACATTIVGLIVTLIRTHNGGS